MHTHGVSGGMESQKVMLLVGIVCFLVLGTAITLMVFYNSKVSNCNTNMPHS